MASALLSHHRTDVNGPGKHGMTPLMYAAQAGHDRMAVLLLRLRSDRYRCNDQVRRGGGFPRGRSRGFFYIYVPGIYGFDNFGVFFGSLCFVCRFFVVGVLPFSWSLFYFILCGRFQFCRFFVVLLP